MQIVPAILAKKFTDIKKQMDQVAGAVSCVQLDVCDGGYVNNVTWPYGGTPFSDTAWQAIEREEEGMPYWDSLDIELDLMVKDPKEALGKLLLLGPARVVFHLGTLGEDPVSFFESLDPYYSQVIKLGIAVTADVSIEVLSSVIPYVSFVQVMGIKHVGFQGQPFDDRVVDYIRDLQAQYPDLEISVDGGVSLETAPLLIEAGASRLVVGSALFSAVDVRDTIEQFQEL